MHTTGVINPSGTENSFDDDNQLADKTKTHTLLFFFSSRRRHTRFKCDWSSDVCSSDLQICREASTKKIGVLIDAEETWIQDPVDVLTILMMEQFNKQSVVVYNTIQLYRDRKSVV